MEQITMNNQAYVHDREVAVSDDIAREARHLAELWK